MFDEVSGWFEEFKASIRGKGEQPTDKPEPAWPIVDEAARNGLCGPVVGQSIAQNSGVQRT